MVTDLLLVTLLVVMVNVADVLPLGTRTKDGTTALESELLRATVRPDVGAALSMVTVPTDPFPPRTTAGSRDRLLGFALCTVMSVFASKPFERHVMVLVVSAPTKVVVNLSIPELLPLAIVIVLLAKTTAAFELDTFTVRGVAEGEESVRVRVPAAFPGSVDGLATRLLVPFKSTVL